MKKLIILGLVTGGNLFAQQSPAPATTPAPASTNSFATPSNGGVRPDPRLQRLIDARAMRDLTPEQQTKLQEANESYRKTAAPMEERLTRARTELEALVNAETINEADIRAKTQQMAAIEGDLAIARALRLSKLRGFLTPEQVTRLAITQPGMRPAPPYPRPNPIRPMPNPAARPVIQPTPGNPPVQPAPAPAPANPEK